MTYFRARSALLATLLAASFAACSAAGSNATLPGLGASPAGNRAASSAAVDLRSAAPFAILAGSTVTNTGNTHITGNVGISPGTAMTGFPPGVIHGTVYAGDPAAKRAEMDLTTAYNDAMGRVRHPVLLSGNLGGQTLAPGLYKSTSGLAVSSGDLTLDGHGNANAVFIFQMASTFNMTTGRKIVLIRGARARNIFWAVGSSATLGTGCSFFGNLLVYKSISMATGSVMTGRALARLGAVTMQGNTLVRPAL